MDSIIVDLFPYISNQPELIFVADLVLYCFLLGSIVSFFRSLLWKQKL